MAYYLDKYFNKVHLSERWVVIGLKLVVLSLLVLVLSTCGDKDVESETEQKKSPQTINYRDSDEDESEQPVAEMDEKVLQQQQIQKTHPISASSGYSAEIVPAKMTIQEKKKRFKILVLPSVEIVYSELNLQYEQISSAITLNVKSEQQIQKIQDLKKTYKVSTDEQLLMAIKPHPKSIALAQAAMESAWGTSRFFREGKNIFGVWSFNKNEPRIAASKKRGNKTIWLKKYPTITDAIRDYYKVLAKGRAFVNFRQQKMRASDPYELVKHLDKYSEKGAEYGKELASMIRYNKFEQYD